MTVILVTAGGKTEQLEAALVGLANFVIVEEKCVDTSFVLPDRSAITPTIVWTKPNPQKSKPYGKNARRALRGGRHD